MKVVSRLAPTPSGHLHRGNVYNFLLTWLFVRFHRGVLWLRLDDLDKNRTRKCFMESIFSDLEWLGLDWDKGPTGVGEVSTYAQVTREVDYQHAINQLCSNGAVFGCSCSRKKIKENSKDGYYPMTCLGSSLQEDRVWRMALNVQEVKVLGVGTIEIAHRTVVLRDREGIPSYQLACVVDDAIFGVNTIIRGEDLKPSSGIQEVIRSFLYKGTSMFHYHHPLIMGEDGKKLSKSTLSTPLSKLRSEGLSREMLYQDFARWRGWKSKPSKHTDLLECFAAYDELAHRKYPVPKL